MIHTVYFWLKEDLSSSEKNAFLEGLKTLKNVSSATYVHIGPPSSTRRPSIDPSYDYGLLTHFLTIKEHDEYQVDPIHKQFLQNCAQYWRKVQVYDFDEL